MKKKVLKIIIALLLLFYTFASVVNALSFTVTMTPSNTTVPESSEFTVLVKVSNIETQNENGINILSGTLKYDEEIFEQINDTSISGMNSWDASYNPDNGKTTLTRTSFVTNENDVFQIAFKTKEGTNGKSGKIQFTQITASNSETETSASDISITINVGEGQGNDEENTNVNVNTNINNNRATNTNSNSNSDGGATIQPKNNVNNTNSNTNRNTNSSRNTNTNTNTNTNNNSNSNSGVLSYVNNQNSSSEDIPYTGVEDTLIYIIFIIIIVAIAFYIKFEKIDKELR